MPQHRVLAIASKESSRAPLYALLTLLAENGYSCKVSHADEESEITTDFSLDASLPLKGYESIVIFDDGGDAQATQSLAEQADERELVIGGFSLEGCEILFDAGCVTGQIVCAGLGDQIRSKAKKSVDAPAVRSDRLVTGTGRCISGFVVVLIDALGGKIRKVVHSKKRRPHALVVAKMSSWPRYWRLAEELGRKGLVLGVSGLDDIDLEANVLNRVLVIDGKTGRVDVTSGSSIPRSVLVREGGSETVERLERLGCCNVNSAKSMRIVETPGMRLSLAQLENRQSEKTTVQEMIKIGRKYVADDGTVIFGRGDCALISKDGTEFEIVGTERLAPFCATAQREPVGPVANIRVIRNENGWKTIGASEPRMADAALRAALMAQAYAETSDGLHELTAKVVDDKELGICAESVDALGTSEEGIEDLVAGHTEPYSDENRYYLERELGSEGIFVQPDGRFAVRSPRGFVLWEPKELLLRLHRDARSADDKERQKGADDWDEMTAARARHVLMCLFFFLESLGKVPDGLPPKLAYSYSYQKSVGGANFGMATDTLDLTTRVWPWNEDEDYLRDKDKFIRNLPRYNPEYPDESPREYGVYYRWAEPRRSPYLWEDRFEDGTYPLNPYLKQ